MTTEHAIHLTEHALLPYLDRYGLRQPPFTSAASGRFYFEFPSLTQQLNLIQHLVQSTHLILLVLGRRGAGKTTFLDRIQHKATENIHLITLDANQLHGNDELLKALALQHQLPTDCGRVALLHLLDEEAYKLARQDRIPLLAIDNAHALNRSALELLLQLANGTGGHNIPWHILLCGEAQILEQFSAHEIDAPNDPRFHLIELPGLNATETSHYIQQRLTAAGLTGPMPLSQEQLQRIHTAAGGIPGEVNTHAHQALMALTATAPDSGAAPTARVASPQPDSTEPVILEEALAPDIVAVPSIQQTPKPTHRESKTRWPRIVLALLLFSALATVLLFQDRINTLFSSNDIIVTPTRDEPLRLPDQRLPGPDTARLFAQDPPVPTPELAAADVRTDSNPASQQTPAHTTPPASAPQQVTDTTDTTDSTTTATAGPAQPRADTRTEMPPATAAPAISTTDMEPTAADADTAAASLADSQGARPEARAEVPDAMTDTSPADQATPPGTEPLAADLERLLQLPPSSHSLQLLASEHYQNTRDFLARHALDPAQAHVYRAWRNQRQLYILLYGNFPDADSAQQAIARLPAPVRKLKPWARPLGQIQQEIKARPR